VLLERLARTTSAFRAGWERLDAYTRSLIEHGNESTERDISWLDRLIASERATAADPTPAPARTAPTRAATTAAAAAAPTTRAAASAPTMPAPPAAIQEDSTT
jgi:hypothetical protein